MKKRQPEGRFPVEKSDSCFALFDQTPTHYAQVGEARIAYQRFGPRNSRRSIIILIVGHGGQLHYWGEPFITRLTDAGFSVVAFDNRDAGLSDKYDHLGTPNLAALWYRRTFNQPIVPPYTLDEMASDTIALMESLKIEQAHVIGASMGGMIGQIIAARFAQRVCSFTSIMSSSGARHLPQPAGNVLGLMQRLKSPGLDRTQVHDLRVAFWQAIGSRTYRSDAYFDALVARTMARSEHPLGLDRQLAAIWASGDRSLLLADIGVPTHVIHGRDDALFPVAHAVHVARQIRDAELTIHDEMGHAFQPEINDALVNSVIRFLDRHDRDSDRTRS